MEKTKQHIWVKTFLVFYYVVGLVGLSLPPSRLLFSSLVPFSLLLTTALLLYFHVGWTKRVVIVFFLVFLSGLLIEMAGVTTGNIFGNYLYGPALGLMVFGTPLMIGVNWFLLVYCAYEIFRGYKHILVTALLGSFLLVMYDFVLEPVAVNLYWWLWVFGAIPVQNFLAWLLISFFMIILMHQAKMESRNPVAKFLFIIQFLFFFILNLTL
jgi:putative membrane protein